MNVIKGVALGAVLALSLVATGAEAFAADVNGADIAFAAGKPTPPPTTKPIHPTGVTWED